MSVRSVIVVNKLMFRFNVDVLFLLKIVLNLKIFIITFVISLNFYIGLLYRGERVRGSV